MLAHLHSIAPAAHNNPSIFQSTPSHLSCRISCHAPSLRVQSIQKTRQQNTQQPRHWGPPASNTPSRTHAPKPSFRNSIVSWMNIYSHSVGKITQDTVIAYQHILCFRTIITKTNRHSSISRSILQSSIPWAIYSSWGPRFKGGVVPLSCTTYTWKNFTRRTASWI